MFGYEVCLSCKLYHPSGEVQNSICDVCSSKKDVLKYTPLSKIQYERLYEKRMQIVKEFLRPNLPAYSSDVFSDI